MHRRLRHQARRNRVLNTVWRAVILLLGWLVVAAGLAMLVLPGPGWAAVFVGLAILATEFLWARRLLDWTRAKVRAVAERSLDPAVRRRNLLLGTTALVLLVPVVVLLLRTVGVPNILDLVVPDWVAT